jgi:hypothetical protein
VTDDEKDFESYARANWGFKHSSLTDQELSDLLDARLVARDYKRELSEAELGPFRERERSREMEEEGRFESFKDLALERWNVLYPGLPPDAAERILSLRRVSKDYSIKLSLSELGPMFLAQKARQAQEERAILEQRYPPKSAFGDWLAARQRPAPQTYGVSYQGAELLVADWLIYLGERSVQVTKQSGDGGVDVLTADYCCQVKNYTSQNVSSPEVRDLFGTAVSRNRKPLLFTATALTPDASSFANSNSVAVIQFNVQEASLLGLNEDGEELLHTGRYEEA